MKNKMLIRALSALSVTMAFTACRVALETDLQNAYQSTIRRSSGPQMVLVATMETPEGETKTSLSSLQVLWTSGDKIKVFNSTNPEGFEYTLSSGSGQVVGEFTGDALSGGGAFLCRVPRQRSRNPFWFQCFHQHSSRADFDGRNFWQRRQYSRGQSK